MPETPPVVTTAEIANAINNLGDQMSNRLGSVLGELVASLRPGANVRDMPADSFQCWTGAAMPGPTKLLVPAMENRTKVVLWVPTAAVVLLAATEGVPLAVGGNGNTMLLPAGTLIEYTHRAAIYAGTTEATPQLVYCHVEYANFG